MYTAKLKMRHNTESSNNHTVLFLKVQDFVGFGAKPRENPVEMKISNIFKTKGEEFFRKEEEKTTLNILKKEKVVIALGGGAFINKKIRNEVLKNHLSFWLKLDGDILISRIKKSVKRPLAINASNFDLKNMIKNRTKYYSKALYKINCDNQSKKEIVDKILDIYEGD